MADPENKDKIKELLEGHNKKFTTTELIVGIIVLLIIGCGIGYAIFKLLTPAPTQIPPANTITEVQQPPIPQTTTEKKNTVVNQQTNQTQPEVVQNNTSETESQYQSVENNTAQNINTSANQQIGPNIIPPATTNQPQEQAPKENKKIKTQVSQKQRKITTTSNKLTTAKRTVHKRRIKKHVYAHTTKYYIQVSSNKNRKLALLNVIKLRKCGHNAFTKEVEVKGEKFTRVYVGPINGYALAKQEAREIKKQLHLRYLPLVKKDD